jgi:hypothetical protein
MQYQLKDEDYLKLWMYFEDRAEKTKEAMFKALTWTIGFAAALLGFIGVKLTDFEASKATVTVSVVVAIIAGAGLIICLYSWVMLSEAAKHIKNNWARANRCVKEVNKLEDIIHGRTTEKVMRIWNQLLVIVVMFAFAFAAILAWAACRI